MPNGWLEGSRTTLHAVVTFRFERGKKINVFITTCCQMPGGDDILRALIPDNMPGGWKVESSYPQVLW